MKGPARRGAAATRWGSCRSDVGDQCRPSQIPERACWRSLLWDPHTKVVTSHPKTVVCDSPMRVTRSASGRARAAGRCRTNHTQILRRVLRVTLRVNSGATCGNHRQRPSPQISADSQDFPKLSGVWVREGRRALSRVAWGWSGRRESNIRERGSKLLMFRMFSRWPCSRVMSV
jgi:hypothetical protein